MNGKTEEPRIASESPQNGPLGPVDMRDILALQRAILAQGEESARQTLEAHKRVLAELAEDRAVAAEREVHALLLRSELRAYMIRSEDRTLAILQGLPRIPTVPVIVERPSIVDVVPAPYLDRIARTLRIQPWTVRLAIHGIVTTVFTALLAATFVGCSSYVARVFLGVP